jgi:hypothetical protein
LLIGKKEKKWKEKKCKEKEKKKLGKKKEKLNLRFSVLFQSKVNLLIAQFFFPSSLICVFKWQLLIISYFYLSIQL